MIALAHKNLKSSISEFLGFIWIYVSQLTHKKICNQIVAYTTTIYNQMVAFGVCDACYATIKDKLMRSSVSNRLADLRVDSDLTQQQVAEILHCQREVYRRYEKGVRELPLSYAVILADYYRVSLDYLVGRCNNK